MLSVYDAELHSLESLYRDHADKRAVYAEMAARVIHLAESSGPIVSLCYGHPMVYSRMSQLIVAHCREHGLRLRILSGISSIAEIMTALRLDIAARGLASVFANQLLDPRRRIDPTLDLLVMQPGGLGETSLCRDATLRRERDLEPYARLQARLLEFYPEEHTFTSICLSELAEPSHQIDTHRVDAIVALAPALHYGHTWYFRAVAGSPSLRS
jgi:hypothetical protein